MSNCKGCGAFLQTDNPLAIGYTKSLSNALCERCFRIQNYNEYQKVFKENSEFLPLLEEIGKTKSLVLLVVDLFQIPKDLTKITKVLHNPILLVLTKRDLFPVSLYEERLKMYFGDLSKQIVDTVVISSTKNYHFDDLMHSISRHQTTREVYVVGYTNAGKSSMINKILEDYTKTIPSITTSMLPSTTIQKIEMVIDDQLTLIDTPGLLEEGSLLDKIDAKQFKRVVPKKMIRPIVYQVKEKQTICIDEFAQIEFEKGNDFVFYFSNQLEIKRERKEKRKEDFPFQQTIKVSAREDVVLKGLGFFKSMKDDVFTIYLKYDVEIYTRKSLL